MKKEELIEALQKLPEDIEVCLFDHKRNYLDDSGEGSSCGIYKDFEVELFTEKDVTNGSKPFIALSFTNDEILTSDDF